MTLERATPPVNVYEGNGQLRLVVPIPGAHGDHTSVVVRPDRLRVDAACKYPQESQHYLRRDWQVGSWQLDVELPRRIETAQAHASLNFGVLVVMAPITMTGGGGERRVPVE